MVQVNSKWLYQVQLIVAVESGHSVNMSDTSVSVRCLAKTETCIFTFVINCCLYHHKRKEGIWWNLSDLKANTSTFICFLVFQEERTSSGRDCSHTCSVWRRVEDQAADRGKCWLCLSSPPSPILIHQGWGDGATTSPVTDWNTALVTCHRCRP